MKIILFTILLFFIGAFCQDDLPPIPGTDFLGFGYDIRQESIKTALQFPLLTWTYVKGRTYTYPADPDKKVYAVPDQVFVRTVAQTTAESRVYTSVQELSTSTALDIGLDFSQSLFQNSTNQTCVTKQTVDPNTGVANDTVDCSTTGNDVRTKAFSFGAEFNYKTNQISSGEIVITSNAEHTILFSLLLDKTTFRGDFQQDLQFLAQPQNSFANNIQLYFDFLEKYGTHYVIATSLGGTIQQESFTQKSTTQSSNYVGVKLTGTGDLSQNSILAASQSRFTTSITGQIDVKSDSSNIQTEYLSSTNYKLYGGDSNLVNLLDNTNTAQVFLDWKATLNTNPVPIRYRLKEISSLAYTFSPDERLIADLRAATKLFIQTPNPRQVVAIVPPSLAV